MIADSAAGIYAGESLVYRVIGAIDASLAEMETSGAAKTVETQKHIEEYAIECSIVKVWCSEMLERARRSEWCSCTADMDMSKIIPRSVRIAILESIKFSKAPTRSIA